MGHSIVTREYGISVLFVVKNGRMAKNSRCGGREVAGGLEAGEGILTAGPILMSGGLTVATSNPAFSQDLFPGYEQVYGVPAKHDDDRPGDGRQDVRAAGHPDGDGGVGVERRGRADARYRTARRRRDRRLHRGDDHDVQAHGRTLDGADLCRARGGLARGDLAGRRAAIRPGGIAIQAVTLTCGVLFIMLFVYATRIIRVTDKLKMGIVVATSALCLFYLVTMVLSFFGVGVPLCFQQRASTGSDSACSWSAWRRSTCCSISTSSRRPPQSSAPKYMEWYGAFGLMVTLIWLYLEILRLLDEAGDVSETTEQCSGSPLAMPGAARL